MFIVARQKQSWFKTCGTRETKTKTKQLVTSEVPDTFHFFHCEYVGECSRCHPHPYCSFATAPTCECTFAQQLVRYVLSRSAELETHATVKPGWPIGQVATRRNSTEIWCGVQLRFLQGSLVNHGSSIWRVRCSSYPAVPRPIIVNVHQQHMPLAQQASPAVQSQVVRQNLRLKNEVLFRA